MGNIPTEDAAIVTEGHLIHWIGKQQQQLPADTYSETVDLNGAWDGAHRLSRIACWWQP